MPSLHVSSTTHGINTVMGRGLIAAGARKFDHVTPLLANLQLSGTVGSYSKMYGVKCAQQIYVTNFRRPQLRLLYNPRILQVGYKPKKKYSARRSIVFYHQSQNGGAASDCDVYLSRPIRSPQLLLPTKILAAPNGVV